MTKLARLLGNNHPLFRYNIEQLEKATGWAGVDVRLATEILQRAHETMRKLRLDPADTAADELRGTLHSHKDSETLNGCEFVIYEIGRELISFNREDIEENYRYQLGRDENTSQHAIEKLKLELVKRYADHERTHDKSVYNLFDEIGISTNGRKKGE